MATSGAANIAVTGSTGNIGGRVARALAAQGVPLRLVGRDPSRLPDLPGAVAGPAAEYASTDAMVAAIGDAHTLFLVSGRESANRLAEHRSAVDAAVRAGVQRIVYLSFLGASADCTFTFGRDHFHTEEHIRGSGLRHTFLRDSLYADFFALMPGEDGVIRGPAADGRVSAVAQDDVADVAVAVLSDESGQHDGVGYDLTGPEAFTLTEAAARISAATGRDVRFEDETLEQAYASRAHYGAPVRGRRLGDVVPGDRPRRAREGQ
ncbi:SDR family oxidoreductase [Angustibacter luteus]